MTLLEDDGNVYKDDISSSIDIQNIGRMELGIGVSGDGNIIGKDITVVINEAQSYGLTLLAQIILKSIKLQIRI